MTVAEMASMRWRARAAKYTREQLRGFAKNAGRPTKLDGRARRRLRQLLAAGRTQTECAAELDVSVRTVGRAVARMRGVTRSLQQTPAPAASGSSAVALDESGATYTPSAPTPVGFASGDLVRLPCSSLGFAGVPLAHVRGTFLWANPRKVHLVVFQKCGSAGDLYLSM